MKIKIIELLNRIANGEEVAKKIKHWKTEYEKLDDDTFVQYRNKDGYCLDLVQILNDEVEIIEEDKPIEELKLVNLNNKVQLKTDTGDYTVRMIDIEMIDRINRLIRERKK